MIRKARPSSRPTSALPAPAAGRAGISRVDLWSTDKMPIDNSDAAAELQRKGFVVRHNYVGSGQGSVCRVVEFAPGGAKFMHRTETLDYAICLKAWDAGVFAPFFPGRRMHYRNKWYVDLGGTPLLFALGIHGQYLFVDRRNQLVIVMMSSQADPLDAELISFTMTAVSHIREIFALSQ